jgi:hypothetical protein
MRYRVYTELKKPCEILSKGEAVWGSYVGVETLPKDLTRRDLQQGMLQWVVSFPEYQRRYCLTSVFELRSSLG